MPSTVERLDKPSAYYLGRVGLKLGPLHAFLTLPQNKKRKYGQEGPDERDKDASKKEDDALKDATSLYVGNLYGS